MTLSVQINRVNNQIMIMGLGEEAGTEVSYVNRRVVNMTKSKFCQGLTEIFTMKK